MELLHRIFTSFKKIKLFAHTQMSSELARQSLQKWGEPTTALIKLLKREKQTLLTLDAACIIWGKIVTDNHNEHMQILTDLLQRLPVEARENALCLATDDDPARIASSLIDLAPLYLDGFSSLAATIKQEWDRQQCNDDLALAFYEAVTAYGFPPNEAAMSQARVLLAKARYDRAETLLLSLLAENALLPVDLSWSFIDLEQQVKRSPERQILALQYFTNHYPTDQRLGQAWQSIGDLYGNVLLDDHKALDAYFQAEQHGIAIPQLQAYRVGNWDAIPALHHHADYAFPPIVVIDLEVDPQPDALQGSRVFEVAAVRYKGQTYLEHYCSYIKRSFSPAKWKSEIMVTRLSNAPTVDMVAEKLCQFIGNSIVIGHNLQAFDIPELEGMGVSLIREQVIDTLMLARLLHPDSLYHHLALLCQKYNVSVDQTALHSALPDAHACAQLFHAIGDSLLQREIKLITGIRALIAPDSAFDRAILQPRMIPADPTLVWELDPAPTIPRSTMFMRGNQASPAMQAALHSEGDFFVEHTDFDGVYCQSLSLHERSLLTVSSRTRIERILAGYSQPQHVFVLAHPQTLLCPSRLRKAIEASTDNEQKLALFCLYQASHNHDAATLYPLRLPIEALDDPALHSLKQTLIEACCASEPDHPEDCSARQAAQHALATHHILLSTHKNLLARQVSMPDADTIVIDDIIDLQMHLAEYSAHILTRRQVKNWLSSPEEQKVFTQLEAQILEWAKAYMPESGYRERLPLSSLLTYLEQKSTNAHHSLLEPLRKVSQPGAQIANVLQKLFIMAAQKPTSPEHLHAYWIDLWFAVDSHGAVILQQWEMRGLSQDLRETFQQRCWKPYRKRILAGSALTVGDKNTQFLRHYLSIPDSLSLKQDPRKKKRIYLPRPEVVPPAGFLKRREWIMAVGTLLATRVHEKQRAILVTLNNATAAEALILTFLKTQYTAGRQLLAPQLNWTITKINERIDDPERRLLVFASPRVRQTLLDCPVHSEVSGPLRFLNKRDPLVAAQMQVFAHLYPKEGPFRAYQLPQALLELQSRLSSEAEEHIICDGSLLSKGYRDEVLHLLHDYAEVQELTKTNQPVPEYFLEALSQELAQRGLTNQTMISDLHLILRSIWDTETFRPFPPLEETSKPVITQKDIVRATLEKKDQLVIAATGGGKSLCFQMPAIILAEEIVPKVTLVFSPLIALMSNQVEQLHRKGIFSAIMLNSTLPIEQRQEYLEGLKKGWYSIVYLAPEQLYSSKLRDALQYREIGLIAIDEAHCLSQWGHNFRTDYFMIRKWIKRVLCYDQKRTFPMIALTATARKGYTAKHNGESDQASTVADIIEKLELNIREDEIVMSSVIRPELAFHFEYIASTYSCPQCKHTYEYQLEMGNCPQCSYQPLMQKHELQQTVTELKKQKLFALLGSDPAKKNAHLPDLYPRWSQPWGQRQRGLIYCAYQKTTQEVASYLQTHLPNLRISAYHAGMETGEREEILRRFTSDADDGFDVIASTNAFGMGIDIRRLGFVIHFDTPGTPEAYYQEAGRAGRDRIFKEGKECAQCILLFHPSDLEKQRLLSSKNNFSDYEIEDVYKAICEIYERDKDLPRKQASLSDSQTFLSQIDHTLHIFASAQEIAMRAGVEEDQVNTLLYYLEEQTTDTIKQKKLFERGTLVSNIWQLKFEKDYLTELHKLSFSSLSWRLVHLFQNADSYLLNTERFTTISARDLADSLRMPLKALEEELINLSKRRIVKYAGSGQFKLTYPVDMLHTRLADLESDLKKLLQVINKPPKRALEQNELVMVNLRAIMSQKAINTVTHAQVTKFLFTYAHENVEPLRLLERFNRVTRNGQPDTYELQLWLKRDPGSVLKTISDIIKQLDQTVRVLALQMSNQANDNDWYTIDLFAPDLDYHYDRRRKFHQHILVLEALGLLKYISDPAMGQAMHMTLLQPPVSLEYLHIDLHALRLQEKYTKSKRKLMEQYASMTQKDLYAKQFAMYFQGAKPLLEHSQQELRQDLTSQQRQIVTVKEGIHVVEGPAGCGKTTVLAERVKYLVNQGVPIDHILITTHYKSAEGHIAQALKDLESEGVTAISTTINAFGQKIFMQYRHLLLKPDGTPYYGNVQSPRLLSARNEAEEELSFINQALKRMATIDFPSRIKNDGWHWPRDIEPPQFSPDYHSNSVDEEWFQAAIHRLRQYGIFPTRPSSRDELLRIIDEQTEIYSLAECYAVYMVSIQIMAEQNRYTYDDQIVFALAILHTNPDVLRQYQHYFEHIIIDELQDFSPAKIELLLMLCEKRTNIMAFGDTCQAILFDTIKAKKNEKDVRVSAEVVFAKLSEQESCGVNQIHRLNINFRSTQEILDLSSHLRCNSRSQMSMRLLSGGNKHGPKPVYIYTATNVLEDMVDVILDQIQYLSTAEKESIAMIFGNKTMLRPAQDLLRQRNIPFSLMDGQKTSYQLHYVKNVLLYFHLIQDKKRDEETERLLRYNIVPYFERLQINNLKTLANKTAASLFEIISSPKYLQEAKISKKQQESLQHHLRIINDHRLKYPVSQLAQSLDALSDGPLTLLQEQEEKREEVERILTKFRHMPIKEALEEIQCHILFLDKHRGCSDIVLATVEFSKSQEFETVFLLGVNKVFGKRLYVSVSRAKRRLFFVGDEGAFANSALFQMPENLYTKMKILESIEGECL